MGLQYALALAGASAVQGSAYWWARGHRSHHRYTDTALDPYNAKRGLLYAHIGWMLVRPRVKPGRADISDLQRSAVVQWQHRWYFAIIPVVGYALPAAVAGWGWGDWAGGFFYAGMWRITAVHHVSACAMSVPGCLAVWPSGCLAREAPRGPLGQGGPSAPPWRPRKWGRARRED